MGFFTDFINNLSRNFSDPVGLAQDMGAAEEASGIKESERRFKRAESDMNKDIKEGMFYTKPMDISKSEGEQRRDDRDAAKAAQAAQTAQKSIVTETAEETIEDKQLSKFDQTKTDMLNKADTTQSTSSATVEEAKKDKKRGLKGGTIATSAQGLLSSDMTGLRPKRSLLAGA